jgi:hypothetical protein
MDTINIFIASSAELKQDRDDFREFISVLNDRGHEKGIYLKLIEWEYFLDSVSQTAKQDDYNAALKKSQIVICLFYTKAGKYTQQEFDTALQQFKETGSPLIYTYFKAGAPESDPNDVQALDLAKFKKRLGDLKHFYTVYKSIDDLKNQFRNQLDILEEKGFIVYQEKFKQDTKEAVANYFNINIKNTLIDSTITAGGDIRIGDTIYNTTVTAPETKNRKYNLYLCRKLTEALGNNNIPKVKTFLNIIRPADKENWETQLRYNAIAFDNIINSFGVLGLLIRKVIGEGITAEKTNNDKDYIDYCVSTALRTVQLLSFSFISKLWDYKKENNCEFTSNQAAILTNFFNSPFQLNIPEYLDLLKTLVNIFDAQKIEYPFKEFNKDCLMEESNFIKACNSLNSIYENKSDAEETEKELTEFISTLVFLANYKMVSVREISYEAIKSKGAQYLHSYNFLGENNDKDGKKVNYLAKYKYDLLPVSSDAILIYNNQQKYQEGLNLFPFIIDINALTGLSIPKICFYTFVNEEEKKLIYSDINIPTNKNNNTDDINDPSQVVIIFNEEVENALKANSENDITSIKEDNNKHNNLQLNTVYNLFQSAKNEIIV